MNIYDFDNTIFAGDSSVKFIKYSFCHHPLMVTWSFIKGLKECIKYLFKKSDFGYIKSELFSFVKNIDNLDEYMNDYVIKHQKNIKKFYLEQQEDTDVVISASFEFIVKPFCDALGIKNVIATKYDTKKGYIVGKNCKGKEKIVRFNKIYKNPLVKEAYSDSLSDIPMFEIADKAFLVKKDKIIAYEKEKLKQR